MVVGAASGRTVRFTCINIGPTILKIRSRKFGIVFAFDHYLIRFASAVPPLSRNDVAD
jgi:hypothetical protein